MSAARRIFRIPNSIFATARNVPGTSAIAPSISRITRTSWLPMTRRRGDPFAAAAALATLGDWLRFGEKLYAREKVALGQVATNAHDEVLYLLLRTLGLPLESDTRVLAKKLTGVQRSAVTNVLRRRVLERVPAAYLTHEAWLGGHRFFVDHRALLPRSY